jgi:hypothetical protein
VKRHVAAVEALRKKERGRGNSDYTPKLVEKLVWVQNSYFVLQNFIPSYTFDAPIMLKLAIVAPLNI